VAEDLVPVGRVVEPEHPVDVLKGVYQVAHPRRGDRQRAAARAPAGGPGALQAQVQLALPGGQPLPRRRFQQFRPL
jgi:hypothetical protein